MTNETICAIVISAVLLIISVCLSRRAERYSNKLKDKQDFRIVSYLLRAAFIFGIGAVLTAVLIVLLLLLQPLVQG